MIYDNGGRAVGEETSGATNGPVFFVGDARVTVSIDHNSCWCLLMLSCIAGPYPGPGSGHGG